MKDVNDNLGGSFSFPASCESSSSGETSDHKAKRSTMISLSVNLHSDWSIPRMTSKECFYGNSMINQLEHVYFDVCM